MNRDPRRANVERYSGWLTMAMGIALGSGGQVKVMSAISGPGFDLVWILGLFQCGMVAIVLSYTRFVPWRIAAMTALGLAWAVICGLMINDRLWYVTTFIAPVVAGFSLRAAWYLARGTYGR
jgi:hypothetical protein